MTELRTRVMVRGEARFDMVGQKLPHSLHDTDEQITPGLAKRLAYYAVNELEDNGFDISGWSCEVYTMDGDDRPSQRFYTVEFTHPKGGMVGVQGILTSHGWPNLDHGLCIDRGRS